MTSRQHTHGSKGTKKWVALLLLFPIFLFQLKAFNGMIEEYGQDEEASVPLQEAAANYEDNDGIIADPTTKEEIAPMSIEDQNEWIKTKFRAADPNTQEWCVKSLLEGTYWHHPTRGDDGAQFSQDVFLTRNIFFDKYIRRGIKGFYIEAGANDYKKISSTYMYDKCFGWDGLCVEPQKQYHEGLIHHRSCKLVPMCLTKERTDKMMIGGLPAHRGGGMFIKPLPPDGKVPTNMTHNGKKVVWDQVSCAPLGDILEQYTNATENGGYRTHVDLFVLDVEGAEMLVLETIDWEQITFSVMQIENNKLNKNKLDEDMLSRGYAMAYQLETDAIYVPQERVSSYPNVTNVWQPEGDFFSVK